MSFFDPDFVLLRYSLSLAVAPFLGIAARLIFARQKGAGGREAAESESGAE